MAALAGKRKEREDPPEEDWRKGLSWWRGEIDVEDEDVAPLFAWQGTYVEAPDSTPPADEAFDRSKNTFEFRTDSVEEDLYEVLECWHMNEPGGDDQMLNLELFGDQQIVDGVSGVDGALTDMDDRGETHFWGTRGMAAAGVGLTTKGKYVAYGALERRDGAPTMTLARRFVSADDPRAAWTSPEQVLDSILGPKASRVRPWPAAPPIVEVVAAALPWKTSAAAAQADSDADVGESEDEDDVGAASHAAASKEFIDQCLAASRASVRTYRGDLR